MQWPKIIVILSRHEVAHKLLLLSENTIKRL
jgi:hypothetical protein